MCVCVNAHVCIVGACRPVCYITWSAVLGIILRIQPGRCFPMWYIFLVYWPTVPSLSVYGRFSIISTALPSPSLSCRLFFYTIHEQHVLTPFCYTTYALLCNDYKTKMSIPLASQRVTPVHGATLNVFTCII